MTRRYHTLSLPASLPRTLVTSSSGATSPPARTRNTTLSSSLDSEDLSVLHRRSNAVRYRSGSDRSGSEEEIPQEQSPPVIRSARNLSSSYSELQSQHPAWHSYLPVHSRQGSHDPSTPTMTPTSSGSSTLPQRVLSHFVGSVQLLYHSIDRRRYVVRPTRVLRRPAVGSSLQAMGCLAPLQPFTLEDHECCAICLEEFNAGDLVQPMLGCKHLFHRSCITGFIHARREEATRASLWAHEPLGERVKCPLCRGRIATPTLLDVPEQEWDLVRYLEEDLHGDMMDSVTRPSHGQSASRQNSDADHNLSDRTHAANSETAASQLRGVMGMVYPLNSQRPSSSFYRHLATANAANQDVDNSVDGFLQGTFSSIVDLDTLETLEEHS
mmetsp:Transcript_59718/g.99209  ORF Transcript_59718/g.99209 Transcript_59718/m.99209 type:complete len:383 (+) Transcript_59718:49-1197(+)